ncbi:MULTISPECIES: MOSC domain-containing protein [unclassified Nocardioides]|uniref:MOSC domain-containing protein n=1 Tax=unclassified Nocardioides TaxID=2615069 RepID=UPI00362201D9
MRLAAVNLHPVKSTAIRAVPSAYVGESGLRGDREWIVVAGDGTLVTARELPDLFRIVADTPETGGPAGTHLRLSAPGAGTIDVERPIDGAGVEVAGLPTWRGRAADGDADRWLRQALGHDGLRLVWCDDPRRRQLRREPFRPTDTAVFQDQSPVSLVTTASMEQLGSWMGADLPVGRFRPNLVVEGPLEAFAEDSWSQLRIGSATLRAVGPIDRCVMTTIDATTLTRAKEPIRTLSQHRKWDGKTWFAVHLVVDGQGELAVGDEVLPEAAQSAGR